MNILKNAIKVFAVSSLLILFTSPLAFAASTSSGSGGEACEAISHLDPGKGTDCNTSGPSINKLVKTTVNLLTIAAGVIAVIMIIVGGFKYITSQGDATQAANARKTLIYAIAGLVVVVFAQVIVRYVFDRTK